MALKFSPSRRRLARRRHRFTSRKGGILIALILALSVGGALLYWRWQLNQVIEAGTAEATLAEECADLADAAAADEGGDAGLTAQIQKCEDEGFAMGEE